MSNRYKTRVGGSTVTVFVPYDCGNNCPFCINKQEYKEAKGFSEEKIKESILKLDKLTPNCDFVFTGGEPLANLPSLQSFLDLIPSTHRIFINTTLPTFKNHTEDEVVEFLNHNKDKITCVNCSRHIKKYVVECSDEIFGRLKCNVRINCVLFTGSYDAEKIRNFEKRFAPYNIPIQFRADYTITTLENLYKEEGDDILEILMNEFSFDSLYGCRIRCNYEFNKDGHVISYHRTLPYSTITEEGEDGVTYDVLYDVLIKQTGEMHSDWTGVVLDFDNYSNVVYEPYDLRLLREAEK
ncbi:MAG: radical SAM protein [Oscillospiraceae bacterium]|nr:radical SAM protein [Oscillospiraceae bacterium]